MGFEGRDLVNVNGALDVCASVQQRDSVLVTVFWCAGVEEDGFYGGAKGVRVEGARQGDGEKAQRQDVEAKLLERFQLDTLTWLWDSSAHFSLITLVLLTNLTVRTKLVGLGSEGLGCKHAGRVAGVAGLGFRNASSELWA